MNLNIILRGQSNAFLFGVAEDGANLPRFASEVEWSGCSASTASPTA